MCGRFSQILGKHQHAARLFRTISLVDLLFAAVRCNIAPTQRVPVIIHPAGSTPRAEELHWGLVPSWSRDKTVAPRLINARAETLAEKPSFKNAFRFRRCLVPASGFYEWRRDAKAKTKTPYYFTAADEDEPLVFAGLWETWNRNGEDFRSFAIVTTEANALMSPIHDRMPAILPPAAWEQWLAPENTDTAPLKQLLLPADDGALRFWQVDGYVNNPRNVGERCLERIA